MLVRERTQSVGTKMDEGFHVLFCEPTGSFIKCQQQHSESRLLTKTTHQLCPGGTLRCGGFCRMSCQTC